MRVSFHVLERNQTAGDATVYSLPIISMVNGETVAPEVGAIFEHTDGMKYVVAGKIWCVGEDSRTGSVLHLSVFLRDPKHFDT